MLCLIICHGTFLICPQFLALNLYKKDWIRPIRSLAGANCDNYGKLAWTYCFDSVIESKIDDRAVAKILGAQMCATNQWPKSRINIKSSVALSSSASGTIHQSDEDGFKPSTLCIPNDLFKILHAILGYIRTTEILKGRKTKAFYWFTTINPIGGQVLKRAIFLVRKFGWKEVVNNYSTLFHFPKTNANSDVEVW